MVERPARTPEEDALELRKDARHEAGHAVAALHYGCGVRTVSIGGEWPTRGTTQLGVSQPSDAVAVFCGPFAEPEWVVFPNDRGHLSPTDHAVLNYLQLDNKQHVYYQEKALAFLSKPEVQQQIDRVANALLERTSLTVQDVKDVAEFADSLRV